MRKADALLGQGEYAKAEPLLRQHLRSQPADALANEWLGGVLMFSGRLEQGLFHALRALELSTRQTAADVLSRRHELAANIYAKTQKYDLALKHAQLAVQTLATPHALNVLAAVHLLREDLGSAFEPCRQAYESGYNDHTIVSNYAMLLGELGQPEKAAAVLLKAMREHGRPTTMHALVPALNYPVPTREGERAADPLPAAGDDPDCVDAIFKRRFAAQYANFLEQLAQEELAGRKELHSVTDFSPERPLRVAIASYDMRMHSCSYFLRPLLRHLRRPGLTIVGVYTSAQVDEITEELKGLFDDWMHVPNVMPPELAQTIAKAKIDVLVECGGYTAQSPMFACSIAPAPVQVTYLGYPGTTGMRAMHYRIVDERTDPSPAADGHCVEKLVRLPGCFLCFDPGSEAPRPRDESVLGRADTTMVDGKPRPLTFGSFSTAIKLSQATFDQWCAVLRAVPDSRMLIKASILGTAAARQRALDQFAQRGVDASRVELIARVPSRQEHLRIYDRMDVALDTYPYVGTTTICESLMMNVPYLSRYGHQHINRVGLSLLSAVGAPELACESVDALVAKAVQLNNDRGRLSQYHRCLREQMMKSCVGDGPGYAEKFAEAIRGMWREQCAKRGASAALLQA